MKISEYLKDWAEACPEWLHSFDQHSKFDPINFFGSRIVFYPGSGHDGQPVKLFGGAHAAHCFVYADYLTPESSIRESLDDGKHHFRGYHTLARFSLTPQEILPKNWQCHVMQDAEWAKPQIQPYGFLEVLERDGGLTDEHGAERLAILFLGADGHATYDALFCQGEQPKPLFAILLQDHGFGGNYSNFGQGGLMEEIATASQSKPQFLLVGEHTSPWDGYVRVSSVEAEEGGMHQNSRRIFKKS